MKAFILLNANARFDRADPLLCLWQAEIAAGNELFQEVS
jgi:hypothetical protein